ncbi:MAG: aspartate/glutamate racemase family protein [Actinomycetota bacterium]
MTSVLDAFRARAAEDLSGADVFHVLNEGLLQDLLHGVDTDTVFAAMAAQLAVVERQGAQLIVMTCSSTSPGVDVARRSLGVPVLKIDDPMARRAVGAGSVIGVLCTASSTLAASTQLLQDHAAEQERPVTLRPVLVDGAYDALQSGDRDTHDRLVSTAAAELAPAVDVLVLAQASLAHLQQSLADAHGIPVLSSPPLLFDELQSLVRARS